jgi:hypothetical protein
MYQPYPSSGQSAGPPAPGPVLTAVKLLYAGAVNSCSGARPRVRSSSRRASGEPGQESALELALEPFDVAGNSSGLPGGRHSLPACLIAASKPYGT